MQTLGSLRFHNTFARLPEGFHRPVNPDPLGRPYLIHFNPAAAGLIDLDPREARRPDFAEHFGGARLPAGAEPIAALYAGHQFGHYVPQLGDGRALLLGEVVNGRGERWDVQLKGGGRTPYSRDGDGRAVLRSSIREYLASEALHGLGIPTTRALCLVGTDDEVYRERIETGATLVRLAPSHVRFGSFEVHYHRGRFDALRVLADHVIGHHFPELEGEPDRHPRLLEAVIERTAALIARWQLAGFAHGVMNTDNMSILGLTLDYGPYGFLDAYDPGFICNHSDHWGRYAFDRQPAIGLWNLGCLAQAFLPLIDAAAPEAAAERARALLEAYQPAFYRHYGNGMQAKLGLRELHREDAELSAGLLRLMAAAGADYTLAFRELAEVRGGDTDRHPKVRDRFADRAAFDAWLARYRARLRAEASDDGARRAAMEAVNPLYVLRNHLAQHAIERAHAGDFTEIDRLMKALADPWTRRPGLEAYAAPPPEGAPKVVVSCSS
ncbi:MAG: YdiU family protein [Gammaproteobacteria bacterium]|nr:YdiU family protein [Gammaproteobacteria bacterium]